MVWTNFDGGKGRSRETDQRFPAKFDLARKMILPKFAVNDLT